MKKLFNLFILGLVSSVLISCNQTDVDNLNKVLYIGHISIVEDTLKLDEVEWITDENQDRITELGLTQSDMPNGYYINNPSTDTVSFKIAEDTEYNFVVLESLSYYKDGEDRSYSTTKKEEFMEFLNNVDTDKVVFWIEVKDGFVVSVKEQFTN